MLTPTVFESLDDAGVRTACTPFLIFRGRTRHELALAGLDAPARPRRELPHAVYGPAELFYGELYSSRDVDCQPTLARPGTRDAYSGCVGEHLARYDLYDFLLFSLPDNDHYSHRHGPDATVDLDRVGRPQPPAAGRRRRRYRRLPRARTP